MIINYILNITADVTITPECTTTAGGTEVAAVAEMKRSLDSILTAFERAMCDDLNTPKAIAALFQLIALIERYLTIPPVPVSVIQYIFDIFKEMNEVLGISYTIPTTASTTDTNSNTDTTTTSSIAVVMDNTILTSAHQEAVLLANERMKLKAERNFKEADILRERVAQLGFLIRDKAAADGAGSGSGGYDLVWSPTAAAISTGSNQRTLTE